MLCPCRNAGVTAVVRRPGKRATLLAAGGQIFAGIRAGLIFSMLEEYDFEEDDWYEHICSLLLSMAVCCEEQAHLCQS